ncbi:ATP-binding protein [Saccharothrix obliqua]|uniref:ATP-binding protein n=1 Tax=Saccharothrix obliqua TaxID=2861747 RepID=UPI001C5DC5E8|nr:tetratricopeptide repeat protein [Saccharothrix obliqua]MBW4720337.1 tetratricopeptide repeat protein [Saccharothrix obliqua]
MVDTTHIGNVLRGPVGGHVVQAGVVRQLVVSPPEPELRPVPRQLPPAVRDFTGRVEQMAELDALISSVSVDGSTGTTVISALSGTPGVGKTALAVRWAHRVQHRFPDGTLFADLGGFGPGTPLDPAVVLSRFLGALGVPERRAPVALAEQSALYRSLLSGRRVLVVLDNVGEAEQVRPLLPGSPGSFVLVTSRVGLSELVIVEAAKRVAVDLFDEEEAVALVTGVIGADRVEAEPSAVRDLVGMCARLPLALRVATARIASRRYLRVADVVAEIRDERRGANMFGNNSNAVEPVFGWSYTRLSGAHARVFRCLGLHPELEFGVPAVAALAGVDVRDAVVALEALADQHLVEPVGRDRYRMHDLLHAYAARLACTEESADARDAALGALCEWYACAADAADRLIFPDAVRLPITTGTSAVLAPINDRSAALEWFDLEQHALRSTQRSAAVLGLEQVVVVLAAAARHLGLRRRALWPERLAAESLGLSAARNAGDRASEAFLLVRRGQTHRALGDHVAAVADFSEVLALAEADGDHVRLREAVGGLALTYKEQHRYIEAWAYYEVALNLAREAENGLAEAIVMCNLSQISSAIGRYRSALAYAERELELRTRIGSPIGIAYAQHDLAVALQGLGRHSAAADLCELAVAGYTRHGGAEAECATALETLATSLSRLGEVDWAVECLRQATAVLAALEDPRAEQVRRTADALASGG